MEFIKEKTVRAVKWSEKYLKTDMVYITKNGFWLTSGQFLASASALILSVVFANILPKEVYGNYKFILSATGILGAFSLTGMSTIVTQSVANGAEGTLFSAVKTNLRWGMLILGIAIFSASYYFVQENDAIAIAMIIAGLALPITNAYGLYGSFLSGRKNFKDSTIYWSISQLVSVLVLIGTALLSKNAVTLIIAYFLSNGISALFFYTYTVRKHQPNEKTDSSIIWYGKHISVMNLFGTIANQLDKILVFHYLGAVELAVYSFSMAIPEQIKGSYKNLFSIVLPKYASMETNALRRSVIQKTWQLTGLTIFVVIVYMIGAPFIYKLFFPKYLESVLYSQIYILGLLAIPGLSLFATYFQVRKKTKTQYKLSIMSNASTIILSFFLIYHYGLLGAVVENGVSWFIMLGLHTYYFVKDTEDVISV